MTKATDPPSDSQVAFFQGATYRAMELGRSWKSLIPVVTLAYSLYHLVFCDYHQNKWFFILTAEMARTTIHPNMECCYQSTQTCNILQYNSIEYLYQVSIYTWCFMSTCEGQVNPPTWRTELDELEEYEAIWLTSKSTKTCWVKLSKNIEN